MQSKQTFGPFFSLELDQEKGGFGPESGGRAGSGQQALKEVGRLRSGGRRWGGQGMADAKLRPTDVDREMVVFFNIVDEGPDGSFYYEENRALLPAGDGPPGESEEEDPDDKFYTINGAP